MGNVVTMAGRMRSGRHLALLLFAAALLDTGGAVAAPSGGAVAAGNAAISQNGKATTITQNSGKAIINWNSFDVCGEESVTFQQPGKNSIALNRVVGHGASKIDGSLTANGQVWLINPSGVLFGPGAKVDVHGIVATTTDIDNGDFLSGQYAFRKSSTVDGAAVVNQGDIHFSDGGYAVLSGAKVENAGTVMGRYGMVVLGGVPTFTLDLDGDGLIRFVPSGEIAEAIHKRQGVVKNTGSISDDGGTILLSAAAAGDIAGTVINTSGLIEAHNTTLADGQVVLNGGAHGRVLVGGEETAPALAGGSIDITGRVIEIQQAVNAEHDVRIEGKYISTLEGGIVRGERLELASKAPPGHPTGGDVALNTDVHEIAAGKADPANTDFGVFQLTNVGDLTIGTVGATSGLTAHSVDLLVGGALRLDQAIHASNDGNAVVVEADRFVNHAGADALDTPQGRSVVYSHNPDGDELGGIPATLVFAGDRMSLPPDAIGTPGNVFVYQSDAPPVVVPEPVVLPEPSPPPDTLSQVTKTVIPSYSDNSSSDERTGNTLVQVAPVPVEANEQDLLFANDGNRELWGLSVVR